MEWIAAALAAGNFALAYLWISEREQRIRLFAKVTAISEQLLTVKGALTDSEDYLVEARKEATELNERIHQVRQQEQTYARQRIDVVLAQNQAMAERLATLKMKWVGPEMPSEVAGEFALAEDPVVGADLTRLEAPYSPALSDFISSLESEDAREMVEGYVEARRAEGMIDDQILEKLERGEY